MTQDQNNDVVGAIKIKDGLFIGDEFAAQDLEFVVANKVTHVINCAGRQIPNHWEPIALVLDSSGKVATETFDFIEQAYSKGESTLIHSVKGQSRACTVCISYLMRKHRWALGKTLEFMRYRRPDLDIRPAFIQQLVSYDALLAKCGLGAKTTSWNEVYEGNVAFENEELLLRNTYINAHIIKMGEAKLAPSRKEKKTRRLQWVDGGVENTKALAIVIVEEEDDDNIDIMRKYKQRAANGAKQKPILRKEPFEPKRVPSRSVVRPESAHTQKSKQLSTKVQPIKCKELDVKETKQNTITDFLQELNSICPDPSVSKKRPQERPQTANLQKENLAASAPKPGTFKNPGKPVVPFTEGSNVSHIPPPKKIDPKSVRSSQRSASASVRREVTQSPKVRSKEADTYSYAYSYSAKKELTKNPPKEKTASQRHQRVGENNRNSTGLAFYSFKQAPVTIGGEMYSKSSTINGKVGTSFGTLGGPVKAVPVTGSHPVTKTQESVVKIVKPHRNTRIRPASPGVRGKTLESPYSIYAASVKAAAPLIKQSQRIRSGKIDRRIGSKDIETVVFKSGPLLKFKS